jgi:hypothetical protein
MAKLLSGSQEHVVPNQTEIPDHVRTIEIEIACRTYTWIPVPEFSGEVPPKPVHLRFKKYIIPTQLIKSSTETLKGEVQLQAPTCQHDDRRDVGRKERVAALMAAVSRNRGVTRHAKIVRMQHFKRFQENRGEQYDDQVL